MKARVSQNFEHPFVAVAGNVAVGKSGLVRNLASVLDAEPLLEDIDVNPFFERFYEQPADWAFHSQLAFVIASIERQANAPLARAIVQDRTAYESIDVFCQVLHQDAYIRDDEMVLFSSLREVAAGLPRQPTTLIYLHAPSTVIMDRLRERDRPAERHIDEPYIDSLTATYERFVSSWTLCPVLRIDTHATDVRRPEEVDKIASAVQYS
ncbi:MAG: deoxynucleoside kinase [Solirubrobacterales bacterium]